MVLRPQINLPRWSHFVIPFVLTALVVALRFALRPILGDAGPFFLASLAVLVSAFIGGFWPGMLAMGLTTTAGTILFLSHASANFLNDPLSRILLGAHITVSACISFVCGALRSSEMEAEKNAAMERESRSRLGALFNSITDKLLTLTPDLKVISFNEAAGERWNLREEHKGMRFNDVLPESLANSLTPQLHKALQTNDVDGVEVLDDSSGRTYEVRAFPSPEGLLVYFHNVTERIQANEAIATLAVESERANALLDSLLTHAPLGFAFFNRDFQFEKVNQQLTTITGRLPKDHAGLTIQEVLPEVADKIEPIVHQVFQTGKAVDQIEIRSDPPQSGGEARHWQTGFYPVTDSGEIKYVGFVVVEITQRKQFEDLIRQSEERFRNLSDNAPMMVWVCDLEGKATWFNKSWLDFKKVTLEGALEQGCFSGIHPEDEPWVLEAQAEAIKRGEPFSVEYRIASDQGEYRWLHVRANPIQMADGETRAYLMSGIDVSDRISMEENLRRSLANERAARSEAETANRLKDEFLASLSHELRTPLTTMLGWTELLLRPNIPEEEVQNGLQTIQRSSKLQLQLINDLLDMSRISIGKISLDYAYAELAEVALAVVELVQPSAGEKEIELKLIEGAEPIIVYIDTDRFSQILWNLLSNAIKFTSAGGRVEVKIGKENGLAFVSITDTGIGIEPEFLPHVFDRFRQADATRSRRHGGLGLGLAIGKNLAELHGGSIKVESEGKGKGSTFTVFVPLSKAATEPIKPVQKTLVSEANGVQRLQDVCILVLEDDVSSRDFLSRVLTLEGAVVIPAESAKDARKRLRETSPDLIISDIGLPEEDGYQFIRSVRSGAGNENSAIPAVALTAFAASEDRLRAFEAGFNLFLTKPIEPEELVRAVMEVKATNSKPAGGS